MFAKLNNSNSQKENKLEFLRQLRILKKILIHIHGIPKGLANKDLLESEKYLGQYGTINKLIVSYKISQDTNKKAFSAYVTYSNELEAAIAILCIDSLLIQGKIIRAFFGTTKYCNYFLNNDECPNFYRCIFSHQYIDSNDIIINNNSDFTYNEHINLAKKIIYSHKLEIKCLLQRMNKLNNNIFPSINFIFLSEEEKEKYFTKGNIRYFKTNNNNILNTPDNKIFLWENTCINDLNVNSTCDEKSSKFFPQKNLIEINNSNYISSNELYKKLKNSIYQILKSKSFYSRLKNINLPKLELEYFIEDLKKRYEYI